MLEGFLCVLLSTLLFLSSFALCTVVANVVSASAVACTGTAAWARAFRVRFCSRRSCAGYKRKRERELTFALRCINNDAHDDDDDAVRAENWVESCT